ncbi:MAG: hypothetical protein JXA13_11760 [Anaerolineales bacterium]|nr:hypothetical protein [Anaerolineales bacterium]
MTLLQEAVLYQPKLRLKTSQECSQRAKKNKLEAALATPYLVINRVTESTPAVIVDRDSFLPGHVIIEGFVVSLEDNRILCSYRVEVSTSQKTVYYRVNGAAIDQALALVDSLQNALEKETRLAIQETLIEITGGTVQYDESYLP